jgi:acyl-[acyl-carrier-protein]-phospholipid O-acyltransferase/long-chain-fatty-acid--[acyl-carrier-protein] ligase
MENHSSYGAVLKVKGVQPFLWMQFLNAFNDNVYKLVVSLLAVLAPTHNASSGTYLSLAGFVFIAPFLVFSGHAGQLADKFEKRSVVLLTKAIEIAGMTFALFALVSGNINWMLAVLFITATQAAFFSPAKYGIVPELVEERHLTRANGLLEMSTFIAIILGTVFGTSLVAAWKHEPARIGAVLIGIAVLGTVAGLRIPRTPAPAANRPFSWNPFGDVCVGLASLAKDRTLMLTVAGTTFFWFLGALFQMLILLFGQEALHASEMQAGLLMASLAVGIGAGSMAAGRLSGDRIEPGLVPLGAAGMAISAFVLAFGPRNVEAALASLMAIGFMGGLFIVPLNAIQQHRPADDERGRILGTANFVNTIGIMAASGMFWLLHEALNVSIPGVIAIAAGLTALAGVIALQLVPDFAVRFVLYLLTRAVYRIRVLGSENVPRTGPALLVANHVSFVDGFLIAACFHRFVRFMVDETYYRRFQPIFRLFHAIPVQAGSVRGFVRAIAQAREELARGKVVCIFAEGVLTVNGSIGEFHRGLEKIAQGLDVPVIPVHVGGVWGSIFSLDRRASLWRSIKKLPFPITVSFGKPMNHPAAFEVRQAVSELGANAAHLLIADNDTLGARFVRTAKKHWTRRAVMDSSGRTLRYGEMLVASLLAAKKLREPRPEETTFGIMLPASVASAVVNVASVLAASVPVNLNFTAGREAMDSAIQQCGIRTVVTSKRFLAKAGIDPRPDMVFIEDFLSFGAASKVWQFLRARMLPGASLITRGQKANDLAAVLFSSGSTATPKGIMLSHRNVLSNADAVNALFQIQTTDTVAGVLPHFHSFGFTYTLWFPLLNGATAAYHPDPLDAKGLGELIRKSQATFLPAAPSFCQAYVRRCTKEQFASLRYVLVGAEKLQPALADAFEEKFGLKLLEGYGATEMAPVISVNVPDVSRKGVKQVGYRPGTVGRPVPGVAAKVVDRETGEDVECGREGLLLVKGPNRMMGYLGRPAETAAALRDDWYVTGDIAAIDGEGFIRLLDRESRFSKIGGEMVPHVAIEEVLQRTVPGAACVVTAVPDEHKGERLVAFVAGHEGTARDIWQGLMRSDLPKLWVPKQEDIRSLAALPVLGTGKVDLRAVKRMASA